MKLPSDSPIDSTILGRVVKADFTDLAGKWEPDPGFDDIVPAQRQIDAEKWKQGATE